MVFQAYYPKSPGADTLPERKPCLESVQPHPSPNTALLLPHPSRLAAGTPSRHPANRTAAQTLGRVPEQREQQGAPGSAHGVGPGLSVVVSS